MYMFQAFYFFYNEFFFHNELPRWVPYGFYGVQSDYFLVTMLSPSAYFTGLLGWALNIKDTLLLFNLSLFLEQLIYLLGTYLLARKLFSHLGTVFFVCLTVLCSTVLFYQFNQNFHIYNFLPLVVYLLAEFFTRHRVAYLAAGMVVFLASLLGNSAYFFPVMVLPLVIITPALFMETFKDRRCFLSLPGRDVLSGAVLLSVFVVMAAVYYYFNINAMERTEGVYIGRDPATMVTDLQTFLTYAGGTIGHEKFAALLYPGPGSIISGITLHVGLLTLVSALYALVFVRRPVFVAFACVVILFVLLSFGSATPVAELLYNYFPTMKYYRHIGHSVANLKLFLPFIAAFGVEHFLGSIKKPDDEEAPPSRRGAGIKGRIAEGIVAASVVAGTVIYTRVIMPERAAYALVFTALFLMALFFLLRRLSPYRRFCVFLGACAVFQMLSYQGVVNYVFYLRSEITKPFRPVWVMTNRDEFQESRTFYPPTGRSRETLPLVERGSVRYTLAYNFLQWDPCVPTFRTDFMGADTLRLLKARGGGFGWLGDKMAGMRLKLPYDVNLLRSLGCAAPKLRLFPDAIFPGDLGESVEIIRGTRGMDKVLVLNGVPEKLRSSWDEAGLSGDADADAQGAGGVGSVEVHGFEANEVALKATVPWSGGGWLYYADAWHPGWKAYVNGLEVPVARANIAFKAVRLDKGVNSVRFVFDNRRSRVLGGVIIVFELIFVCAILAAMAFGIYRKVICR